MTPQETARGPVVGRVRSVLRGQVRRRELFKHVAAASLLHGRLFDSEGGEPVSGPRQFRLSHDAGGGQRLNVGFDGETVVLASPDSETQRTLETRPASAFGRRGGDWSRQATLAPGGEGVQFGTAVAVNDGTALVGDPFGEPADGDGPGVVWAFDSVGDSWTRTTGLTAPGHGGTGRFGAAIALDRETALVGAPTASTAADDPPGVVSVFTRTDGAWTRQGALAPERTTVGRFGGTVALDGDTAAVSASRRTEDGTHGGLADVFDRRSGRWVRTGRLTAGTDASGSSFGTDVAVGDDAVLVGAPREANGSGAAYLFARDGDTWTRRRRFRPRVDGGLRRFGSAVALDGETALVVAEADSGANGERADYGAVHVFRRTDSRWHRQRIVPIGSQGAERELAGTAALADDTALVGTQGVGSTEPQQSGAAYLVEVASGGAR